MIFNRYFIIFDNYYVSEKLIFSAENKIRIVIVSYFPGNQQVLSHNIEEIESGYSVQIASTLFSELEFLDPANVV